jgi:hypothetical protein
MYHLLQHWKTSLCPHGSFIFHVILVIFPNYMNIVFITKAVVSCETGIESRRNSFSKGFNVYFMCVVVGGCAHPAQPGMSGTADGCSAGGGPRSGGAGHHL